MAATTTLVGLDFGTTTSSALAAEATVRRNAVTGRMELTVIRETYRSPLVFTPLDGDVLDLAATLRLVDDWLNRAGVIPGTDIGGGGALLTGLTARRENATGLVAAIRARLGTTLIATADDPCLESWLAFQGSCAALSRRHPRRTFIHLDIGGGTTNLACGIDGTALATGCLFVGARHVRFVAGSRRIEALSRQARALFAALGIRAAPGDDLPAADLERVLDWYLALLDRAVAGAAVDADDPTTLGHLQIPFLPGAIATGPDRIVTLSGGVGELVYAAARGEELPGTSAYGDLGVDLARRLLVHPTWSRHWREEVPEGGGRATVAGLLRHATRISGASIHLPAPRLLPLTDLPIVATLEPASNDAAVAAALGLARRSGVGAAVRVRGLAPTADAVRAFGRRLAAVLESLPWRADRPLVLLLDTNCGQALGQCATRWGGLAVELVIVDELDLPAARWVSLGRERDGVVPVSFHGLEG